MHLQRTVFAHENSKSVGDNQTAVGDLDGKHGRAQSVRLRTRLCRHFRHGSKQPRARLRPGLSHYFFRISPSTRSTMIRISVFMGTSFLRARRAAGSRRPRGSPRESVHTLLSEHPRCLSQSNRIPGVKDIHTFATRRREHIALASTGG